MTEKKVPLWYAKARIKVKNGLATAKEAAGKAVDFTKEHPEIILPLAGLVVKGIHSTSRLAATNYEKNKYEKSFYDTRLGRREWCRRKPTRTERNIITERFMAGEPYRLILSDMNLLKD